MVFQGEVNPDFRRQIANEYGLPLEDRITLFLRERRVRYVSLDEYRPGIGPQDWNDNMHMNDEGRRKLTDAVIPVLQARINGNW